MRYLSIFCMVSMLAACTTEATRATHEAPLAEASAAMEAAPGQAGSSEETSGAAKPDGKPDPFSTAKVGAPVNVSAQIMGQSAQLELEFRAQGTDVSVRVWGTDGLEVTGESTLMERVAVKAGESVVHQVPFSAPDTECNLAVGIFGRFGGKRLNLVRSFTVNESKPADAEKPANIQVDSNGRTIHVLKSE